VTKMPGERERMANRLDRSLEGIAIELRVLGAPRLAPSRSRPNWVPSCRSCTSMSGSPV